MLARVLLLAACQCAGVAWAGPAWVAPARAAPGCGTVVMPGLVGIGDVPNAVATLHPALYTGGAAEVQMMNLLYRPLIWVGKGMTITWDDSLASAIEPNADDTVFTVTLKPYRWSDGRAVTAGDVVYDWTLIKELGAAYSQYGLGGVPDLIRDVRAVDAHHVAFETTRRVNPEWFELSAIGQFYALPRQAWGALSIAQQQTRQSEVPFYDVVDGPFRLAELALGRHAVFVPNERYGGHLASIRRLVIEFLQGTDPLEALEAGEIDMATLPFTLMGAADKLHGYQRLTIRASPQFGAMTPNLTNPNDPFFADVRVRQAIARAIDQKRIIASAFHGQASYQAGVIPSAMPDLLSPALRNGGAPFGYDPQASRRLLDEAGWKPGPDGVRVKDGRRLAFSVLVTADAETRLLLLQIVQDDLARVGIAVTIREVEFNQLIARMVGPPSGWDATFLDYSVESYPDPFQYFATGASGNYEHYSDKTMDALLATASRVPGRDGLFAVEDYVVQQQPIFFLPDGDHTVLVRPGIEGVERMIDPNSYLSPEYLTLSGPMACEGAHA